MELDVFCPLARHIGIKGHDANRTAQPGHCRGQGTDAATRMSLVRSKVCPASPAARNGPSGWVL
jgi:hypothetical protein